MEGVARFLIVVCVLLARTYLGIPVAAVPRSLVVVQYASRLLRTTWLLYDVGPIGKP